MKEFLKKYKIDIILVSLILIASLVGVICFNVLGKKDNKIAYIYSQNELVETLDLAKEKDELRYFSVDGKHGEVKIAVKKNDIKIVESTCPNKNCIHQGSATTLKPVICAYNEVVIELKGKAPVVIEVG